MENFPSCSHHAIGKEVRPPKISVQLEFIGAGSNLEH